jgi:hypothetical protein
MTLKPKDTRTDNQKEALHNFIMEQMLRYENATLHGHNELPLKLVLVLTCKKEYKDIIEFSKKLNNKKRDHICESLFYFESV